MASSNSGITTDSSTGERYIPSSVRADGTKRREIRVRPGYRPPEDVELYKNRAAAAWKNRGKSGGGGVPGAEGLKEEEGENPAEKGTGTGTSASTNANASTASNKNAKRRENRKKAKASEGGQQQDSTNGRNIAELENWRSVPTSGNEEKTSVEPPVDADAENEKKARNLKKKLRQARDLRDKKNQGEALLPEQLEKVIKIQELIRQLDSLGFNSNGDKRDSDSTKDQEKENEKV